MEERCDHHQQIYFLWGLHPDITPDDIVNDQATSNIIIEKKDVLKKSIEGSALLSFKVSVCAEDLQLSLDPSIWPMRVKVREYVYYPKKKTDNSSNAESSIQNPSIPNVTLQPPQLPVLNEGASLASTNIFSALAEVSA